MHLHHVFPFYAVFFFTIFQTNNNRGINKNNRRCQKYYIYCFVSRVNAVTHNHQVFWRKRRLQANFRNVYVPISVFGNGNCFI